MAGRKQCGRFLKTPRNWVRTVATDDFLDVVRAKVPSRLWSARFGRAPHPTRATHWPSPEISTWCALPLDHTVQLGNGCLGPRGVAVL